MKKLFLLLFTISAVMNAQERGLDKPCGIESTSPIVVGQPATFEFPDVAQCNNCYDWDVVAGSAVISQSWQDQTRFVTVIPSSLSFTLRMTYFDETGCHTCTKTFTSSEPVCDFEPEFITKFDCSPEGTGSVVLGNLDLSEVESVTYYFEPLNNQGPPGNTQYFENFSFDGAPGNGLGIQVLSEPFYASCSYLPGTCSPNDIITLSVTIEFVSGSDCETISEVYDIDVIRGGGRSPLVKVYPNPATTDVQISLENMIGSTVELQLVDLNGTLLKTQMVRNINSNQLVNEMEIPTTNSKVLFLKVLENNQVIETKKILRK